MSRIFIVPDMLYNRMNSRAYVTGRGGWQNFVKELRACEQPPESEPAKTEAARIQRDALANARIEGRMEGIALAIQTLRDLEVAEETEGK